jgi:hypothetical protein
LNFGVTDCTGGFDDDADFAFIDGSSVPLTVTGTLDSLSVYIGATQPGAMIRLAIYRTNGAGNPSTLVAETAEATAVVGWNTLALPPGNVLTAGTYWIVAQTNNLATVYRYVDNQASSNFVGWRPQSFAYAAFPASITSWVKFSFQSYCMYGTAH